MTGDANGATETSASAPLLTPTTAQLNTPKELFDTAEPGEEAVAHQLSSQPPNILTNSNSANSSKPSPPLSVITPFNSKGAKTSQSSTSAPTNQFRASKEWVDHRLSSVNC